MQRIEDRARLKALTSTQDKRLLDETTKKFPENVCGYKLGIYYEVNLKKHTIRIEYYYTGQLTDVDKLILMETNYKYICG